MATWCHIRETLLLASLQKGDKVNVEAEPGPPTAATDPRSLPRVPAASIRPRLVKAQQRFVSVRPFSELMHGMFSSVCIRC